jgi:hypothetical protein
MEVDPLLPAKENFAWGGWRGREIPVPGHDDHEEDGMRHDRRENPRQISVIIVMTVISWEL